MSKKSTTHQFISAAVAVHGDKYDYSLVEYTRTYDKVIIICPTHGQFLMRPNSHLSMAAGCPKCAGHHKTTDSFVQEAVRVHGQTYDYSLVIYVGTYDKVNILCKTHGGFMVAPHNHVSNASGCPTCAGNLLMTTTEFVTKSNLAHNNRYDYSSSTYVGSNVYVTVVCLLHGEFRVTPSNHIHCGSGCPRCSSKYSKPQISWLNSIEERDGIQIQHALTGGEYVIPGTKYKADGYCKETNTIYEFHGDYWHGNPQLYSADFINCVNKQTMGDLYRRTIDRESEIKTKGYTLVVMWESDWNKLKSTGE